MRFIWNWITSIDRILRGDATRISDLRQGQVPIPVFGVSILLGLLGLVAGCCTGTFALVSRLSAEAGETVSAEQVNDAWMFFMASSVKVPLLFLLTFLVTFPSLYVSNALIGSQLRVMSLLRLLVAALAVNISLLAATGPIVAFFSVCTDSYEFMLLLNVVVYALSGIAGMSFLYQTLSRLCMALKQEADREKAVRRAKLMSLPQPHSQAAGLARAVANAANQPGTPPLPGENAVDAIVVNEPVAQPGQPDQTGREAHLARETQARQSQQAQQAQAAAQQAYDELEGQAFFGQVKWVFGCWMVVFGLVGAQMSWVLRPIVGKPDGPFEFFSSRESNFFEYVMQTLGTLFGVN